MEPIELRDQDAARRFVAEGLWLQRAVRPTAESVHPILEWVLEIAGRRTPVPPVGFIADLAHVALGTDGDLRPKEPLPVPGWPPALARQYEDYVLGKFYADPSFERAADALRRFEGADRVRGVAYLVNEVAEGAGIQGVMFTPAVVRGLRSVAPADVLARAWDDLTRDGPSEPTLTLTAGLVTACRRASELVNAAVVAALEDRSAIGSGALELALRLVRGAADRLVQGRLQQPVRPLVGRQEVPTRVLDEDQYPVGGYSSISTRGSVESLLHSQLAYMEEPTTPREPDLFDVKFTRDELFYYSRDDNQFLRRRRTFVFVFHPDLAEARHHKEPGLRVNNLEMTLALVLAVADRLNAWLGQDELKLRLVFVDPPPAKLFTAQLEECRYLFREWLARDPDTLQTVSDRAAAVQLIADSARRSQVHALVVGRKAVATTVPGAVVVGLTVPDGPHPTLRVNDAAVSLEAEEPFDHWQEVAFRLLQLWV